MTYGFDRNTVANGPSTVRTVAGLHVGVRPGNPMRHDDCLDQEAHTLWIGGMPAATVMYLPFRDARSQGKYKYGWAYHDAHTCSPHGPFADLEALLDHVVERLSAQAA